MRKDVFANGMTIGLVMSLILLILFIPARAADTLVPGGPFLPEGGVTSVPVGASAFCLRFKSDCLPGPTRQPLQLDASASRLLADINSTVNARITPLTDERLYHLAEYWTYPSGAGDCEDIALEKRRELAAAGISPSALLMTVVRDGAGEGHAVLMVRTDRGDLVLDSRDGVVRLWSETPYRFVKRQSADDPRRWVDLIDHRNLVALN